MLSLIVAASENNSIGKDNQLLWHLPNDLRYFKNQTWGMPVIMGRKTYESVGKPLPGRHNIIVTRQAGWTAPGVVTAASLDEALSKGRETNCREIFVAGGGEIYREAFEQAGRIYLTRVHADIGGDTYFPIIDSGHWELSGNSDFPADDKHAFAYSFQIWNRKSIH